MESPTRELSNRIKTIANKLAIQEYSMMFSDIPKHIQKNILHDIQRGNTNGIRIKSQIIKKTY